MAPGPGLDTVADLERKLALLRAAETNPSSSAAPAFALPAEGKKPTVESKDGKSALLVSFGNDFFGVGCQRFRLLRVDLEGV